MHQNQRKRQALATAASASLLIMLLAGCASGADPQDEPAPTEVPVGESSDVPAEPEPSPEPAPALQLPVVPGDEVVIVTATATAPSGAALDLRLTAHYPHAWNSVEGEAIAAYLDAAGDTSGITSDPAVLSANATTLQIIDLSASQRPGTPAWPTATSVRMEIGPDEGNTVVGLPIDLSDGWPRVSGPGTGTAISLLTDRSGGVPDPSSWANRYTYYGFRYEMLSTAITLSNCVVDVTELGRGSMGAEYWENLWDYGRYDCVVGIGH